MKPLSVLDRIEEIAARVRDGARPTMEFAALQIGAAIMRATGAIDVMSMDQVAIGPERWAWRSKDGMRELSLGKSTLLGCEGYPLLTMRQVICGPLDNQVVTSTLLVGNSGAAISSALLSHLMSHAAAVAGITAISRVSLLDGDIVAELDRIEGKDPDGLIDAFDGRARFGREDGTGLN